MMRNATWEDLYMNPKTYFKPLFFEQLIITKGSFNHVKFF